MKSSCAGGAQEEVGAGRCSALARGALFAAALICAPFACAPRQPAEFRLEGPPSLPVLVPPAPKLTPYGQTIRLRRDRVHSACTIQTPALALAWRGSKAYLVPDLGPTGNMTNLKAARDLERFQADVFQLQERGCFDAHDVSRLLSALANSAPMRPDMAFSLRYGSSLATGHVDLVPGFRLQDVTLIKDSSGRAVGERTLWYRVLAGRGDGVRVFRANRPEVRWYAGRKVDQPPPRLDLHIPEVAQYWRLAWWRAASSADHFNLVIAAVNRSALENSTSYLERTPGDCPKLGDIIPGAWCRLLSPDTVLTAELPIKAQSHTVYVPLTTTVATALISLGVANPASLLPVLKVWRRLGANLYPIRFDSRSDAILKLPLMAGDQLRW